MPLMTSLDFWTQVHRIQLLCEQLKAKLQVALREEVGLVERIQGLEADKATMKEQAIDLNEHLIRCEEEVEAMCRSYRAEATSPDGEKKVSDSSSPIRELEAGKGAHDSGAERAVLAAKINALEQEVFQKKLLRF